MSNMLIKITVLINFFLLLPEDRGDILHLINLYLRSNGCWDTNNTLPFINTIKNLLVDIHCIEQM